MIDEARWVQLLIASCKNCPHIGELHRKVDPFDNPQGRLKVTFETAFGKCKKCDCQNFKPKIQNTVGIKSKLSRIFSLNKSKSSNQ